MDYKAVPFEQRIKENIRSYSMDNLYALDTLTEYCKAQCDDGCCSFNYGEAR